MNQKITSGAIFRFRYRVRNVNGWSLFSPIFETATSTSITMNLQETEFDGGQIITGYELWINEGGASTTFRQVSTYDGF
jgi:hypothetical protein